MYGCGYDPKLIGKATHKWQHGHERTCPRYFDNTNFVRSVFAYLEDYKRGALGDIWDLPAALHDYLQTAELEFKSWETDIQHRAMKP